MAQRCGVRYWPREARVLRRIDQTWRRYDHDERAQPGLRQLTRRRLRSHERDQRRRPAATGTPRDVLAWMDRWFDSTDKPSACKHHRWHHACPYTRRMFGRLRAGRMRTCTRCGDVQGKDWLNDPPTRGERTPRDVLAWLAQIERNLYRPARVATWLELRLFGATECRVRGLVPPIAGAAARFWVGGTGTWDASSTTHWSASTGGASGASAPTISDSATFDTSSGLTSPSTVTIASGATCTGLTISGPTNAFCTFALSANFAPAGTVAINGNSASNRVFFNSNTRGTQRTFTIATLGASSNIDFEDIAVAGAAAPFTGTILGGGSNTGCSGITFSAQAPQAWSGNTTGNYSNAANWTSRVPLPQDDVSISGLTSGTITVDEPRMGRSITMTGSTGGTLTLSSNNNNSAYGSFIVPVGVTLTAMNQTFTLAARNPFTINCVPTLWGSLTVAAPGGTYTFAGNLTFPSTRTFTVASAATVDHATFNVTGGLVNYQASATLVKMGSGTFTVNSAGVVFTFRGTVLCQTSTIVINDTGASTKTVDIAGIAPVWNLNITGGGTGAVTITGSNTFNNITVGAPKTVTFTHATTTTVTSFTATGSAGNVITLQSDSGGVAWTLSCPNPVVCDYLSLRDSTASGATPFFAGSHSTDVSGNTNWSFVSSGAVEWTAAEDPWLQNTYITSLAGAVVTSFGQATLASDTTFPTATVALTGSTTGWPASGTADVWSGQDVVATIHYASISGGALHGVTGGSGLVLAGGLVMAQIQETWTVNDNAPGSPPQTPFWETVDGRGNASMEIVKVLTTSGAGNKTQTVLRGQHGGGCFTHLSGARVQTTLSLGLGYLGSDNNTSVDLGGGRVAWFLNDPNFATAAGQARIRFPGLRNMVAIQTGYDLSTATLTFYHGAATGSGGYQYGVSDFFPDRVNPDGSGQPLGTWISTGIMLDGILLLIGLATSTLVGELNCGNIAFYVDNPTDVPTNWHVRALPMWNVGGVPSVGGSSMADPGDGFIYFFPGLQRPGLAAGDGGYFYGARWARADAKQGKLLNPQFWCGPTIGWSYRRRWKRRQLNSQIQGFGTQSSIHKRADAQWQMSQTNSVSIQYCVRADLNGTFPGATNIFTIPNFGQGISYVAFAHPEQTWAGKAANDVLIGWNPGFANSQTHPEVYYVHFVRLAGI